MNVYFHLHLSAVMNFVNNSVVKIMQMSTQIETFFVKLLTDVSTLSLMSSQDHCQGVSPLETLTHHKQDLHMHVIRIWALLNEIVQW